MFPWIEDISSRFPEGGVATYSRQLQKEMSPKAIEARAKVVKRILYEVFEGEVYNPKVRGGKGPDSFQDLTGTQRGAHPAYFFEVTGPKEVSAAEYYPIGVKLTLRVKQTTVASIVTAETDARTDHRVSVSLELGPVNTSRLLDPAHTGEYVRNVLTRLRMAIRESYGGTMNMRKNVKVSEKLDGMRRR